MSTLDAEPNIAADESTQTDAPLLDTDDVTELIENIKTASSSELPYGSSVFDHSAMAPASPAAAAALARLRAYVPPPFPIWNSLPVSRRAAVLVLLFADRRGDLRVVVTMRAASLRNYSGHAALPGGKADTLEETPFQIARREAFEEIGLPMDDSKLPKSIRIEHLCQLPFNLAKTELAVSPCVAFLHADGANGETAEEAMIPTLDAKEVAAVFSAPFHNFLRSEDEVPEGETVPGSKSDWYDGSWVDWHDGYRWRVHNFYVPVDNQKVTKPKVREGGLMAISEQVEEEEEVGMERYKVWGMTARILVDVARVAYGENPEFEHNEHYGDEKLMEALYKMGRMGEKKSGAPGLTREEIAKEAAKM
ncbi:8-oxo-dGTP diphosphatase [Pseudogymnoascus australis]